MLIIIIILIIVLIYITRRMRLYRDLCIMVEDWEMEYYEELDGLSDIHEDIVLPITNNLLSRKWRCIFNFLPMTPKHQLLPFDYQILKKYFEE